LNETQIHDLATRKKFRSDYDEDVVKIQNMIATLDSGEGGNSHIKMTGVLIVAVKQCGFGSS